MDVRTSQLLDQLGPEGLVGEKLKTQNVTKLKLWQNSNYEKIQNSNCDNTPKLKLCQKLQLWLNLNCDDIQKLKLWGYSKNQIITKFKNLKCEKNQNVTKLGNSNYDKTQTQIVTKLKLWQNLKFYKSQ